MQSLLSKKITIKVYDIIFIHVMLFMIFKIIGMLGGVEGVFRAVHEIKLF